MFRARIMAIMVASLPLAACVGPQVRPEAGTISSIKRVFIVPMEIPPITIEPWEGELIPSKAVAIQQAIGLMQGIGEGWELFESTRSKIEYSPSLQNQLHFAQTWSLSVALAQETRSLFVASGRSATLSPRTKPIPGVRERGRTVLMQNWMAPIRAWYNDAAPPAPYAMPAGQIADAIVEVGIGPYEIIRGVLHIHVYLKLIDRSSGKLLGRADAASFTQLPSLEVAFAAEAKSFKAAAAQAGGRLIAKCLQDLGLAWK